MEYQKPEMIMITYDADDVIRTSPELVPGTDPDDDLDFSV